MKKDDRFRFIVIGRQSRHYQMLKIMSQLKDIGEHQLLEIINQYCDRTINGDDAAILDLETGKQLVVTTDVLVENVHFSDRTTPPHSIGYRAVTANLSDIAAMGGMPIGITVGLSLRGDTPLEWIKTVYQGMQECLNLYQTKIIGGDITRSQTNTIAITALGAVEPQRAIYRHNAQVGDVILVTGYHGLSRAGLEILLHPEKYQHINSGIKDKLVNAHQYPQPRLDVIKCLSQYYPQKAIAGMDSSDGLADAIMQICQQSQVGANIHLSKIKIPEKILAITDRNTALEWVLYGGEDFELVLCITPEIAQTLSKKLGGKNKVIGEIIEHRQIKILDAENPDTKLLLNPKKTFQHF